MLEKLGLHEKTFFNTPSNMDGDCNYLNCTLREKFAQRNLDLFDQRYFYYKVYCGMCLGSVVLKYFSYSFAKKI